MKITDADKELAARFPKDTSNVIVFEGVTYYGKTAAEAKISPKELDRLLKLGLIKMAANGRGYCGESSGQKPGKGWTRKVTGFVRVGK